MTAASHISPANAHYDAWRPYHHHGVHPALPYGRRDVFVHKHRHFHPGYGHHRHGHDHVRGFERDHRHHHDRGVAPRHHRHHGTSAGDVVRGLGDVIDGLAR